MGKGEYEKGRCDQWKDVFSHLHVLYSLQVHLFFFSFPFPRASDVVFVYVEGEGSRKCLELAIKEHVVTRQEAELWELRTW